LVKTKINFGGLLDIKGLKRW